MNNEINDRQSIEYGMRAHEDFVTRDPGRTIPELKARFLLCGILVFLKQSFDD
jgi:hypothetical protein